MNLWQLSEIHNCSTIRSVDKLDINKLIGENLRRIRTRRNLSQEQLATMIGTLPTRISAIEKGREPMGKDYIERICRALKIGPWEFYLTESAPIVTDEKEKELLLLGRKAEKAGVREELVRYGKYMIKEGPSQEVPTSDSSSPKSPLSHKPGRHQVKDK